MMRSLAWGLLFLSVCIGTIIAGLPVALIWQQLPKQNLPLHLEQINGRLWQGRAWVTWQGTQLGQLQWQLDGARLWQGQLVVDWQSQGPWLQSQGQFQAGLNEMQVALQQAQLELAALPSRFRISDLTVSGRVLASNLDLRWPSDDVNQLQGQGQLRWEGASLAHTFLNDGQPLALGILNTRVQAAQQAAQLRLSQGGSGPKGEVNLALDLTGQYVLTGRVEAADPLLQQLLPNQRDGWAELNYQGNWQQWLR